MNTVAFAETTDKVTDILSENEFRQLYSQMDLFYSDESILGIEQQAFEELYIGNPIHSYEYIDGEYQATNYLLYPIMVDDKILLWANRIVQEDGTAIIQLTSELSKEVTESGLFGEEIALLYDMEDVYIITKESSRVLYNYGYSIETRDNYARNDVVYTKLSKVACLNYRPNMARASSAYLSVPMVYQGEGTDICWAASMACIGNYLTSSNYTAEDVARAYYGNEDWNRGATTSQAVAALYQVYNVEYEKRENVPSDTVLYSNLLEGYPIYAYWDANGLKHATVIRGIVTGSYIQIMNPASSFMVAYKSGDTYTYVGVNSSVTNILQHCATKE